MRRSTRLLILAAAAAMTAPVAPMTAGVAGADGVKDNSGGGTFAPFTQVSRRCDYSETDFLGPTGYARPTATIRSDGSTVTADIQINTAIPNMRYNVRLIQMPRPSFPGCYGGDPGVALGSLAIDGAGNGATTVSGPIEPGATGAWVVIDRPDPFSQNPAEFYTTDVIARI